jgi:hypothetical protein
VIDVSMGNYRILDVWGRRRIPRGFRCGEAIIYQNSVATGFLDSASNIAYLPCSSMKMEPYLAHIDTSAAVGLQTYHPTPSFPLYVKK